VRQKTGAELLFEVFSQRYERGSVLVTSNLPFEEWTSVFGSERLTGALLDRLTHHVHILELNGDSYRLKQSKGRRRKTPASADDEAPAPGDHRSRNRRDHFLKKAPKSERPLREGAFRFNRQPRYWTGLLRHAGRKLLRR
jgi:hypothetical protein